MVKAQVANPKRELRSGMFIEGTAGHGDASQRHDCSGGCGDTTPGLDLRLGEGRGKATRRQVELGVRTPGLVEVKSGVESGETVVVGGQERLAESAPVAPKLIQRAPAPGGEESASVGAR